MIYVAAKFNARVEIDLSVEELDYVEFLDIFLELVGNGVKYKVIENKCYDHVDEFLVRRMVNENCISCNFFSYRSKKNIEKMCNFYMNFRPLRSYLRIKT